MPITVIDVGLVYVSVILLVGEQGGISVNPIPTRREGGADYAKHITACPPRFENLTASLHLIIQFWGHKTYIDINNWKKLELSVSVYKKQCKMFTEELNTYTL